MRKGKITRKWVEIVRRRKEKRTPKIRSVGKEKTGVRKHSQL